MCHLTRLVVPEVFWLGYLHPELSAHAKYRQSHAYQGDEKCQLDFALLAVTHSRGPWPFTCTPALTASSTYSPILILWQKKVGPHAGHKALR